MESHDFALSVVVATNKNMRVETYVLADVQAAHTYDLRLARFHLLRKPWMPQVSRMSIPEDQTPPPFLANGSSTHDDDGLGGGNVRSPSKVGGSTRGGSIAPGSVTIGGGFEGSRGGENSESVRFYLLPFSAGLLGVECMMDR